MRATIADATHAHHQGTWAETAGQDSPSTPGAIAAAVVQGQLVPAADSMWGRGMTTTSPAWQEPHLGP